MIAGGHDGSMDLETFSHLDLTQALKTRAVKMRGRVSPSHRKFPTLLRLHFIDDAPVLLIEKDATRRARMIAQNGNLAVRGGPLGRKASANLLGRHSQIVAQFCDLAVADLNVSDDQATAAAAQAFKLTQIFE
jgi:hypothetical protein